MSHTVILGADFTPPPAGGPAVAPPSHGGMVLSSNRGSVFLQGDVEALLGWEGLGPVKREANRSRPLGHDGLRRNRLRPYKRSGREIVGTCHVQGRTPYERAELMDRVIAICSPLDDSEVTLTMSRRGEAVSTSGDVLFAGGSEFMAEAAYDKVAIVQLQMDCPSPFFFGAERTMRQQDPLGGDFFPIGPVILSDSSGFGSPLVLNTGGDWLTYAQFEITGPATTVRATSSRGQTWRLAMAPDPLLGGQQAIVRTDPGSSFDGQYRVEGPGGESFWRYLDGRQFFPLAPVRDTVTFDVTGQTPDTEIVVRWRPTFQAVS